MLPVLKDNRTAFICGNRLTSEKNAFFLYNRLLEHACWVFKNRLNLFLKKVPTSSSDQGELKKYLIKIDWAMGKKSDLEGRVFRNR